MVDDDDDDEVESMVIGERGVTKGSRVFYSPLAIPTHWGAGVADAVAIVAGDGGAVSEGVVGAPISVSGHTFVILSFLEEQLGTPMEGNETCNVSVMQTVTSLMLLPHSCTSILLTG